LASTQRSLPLESIRSRSSILRTARGNDTLILPKNGLHFSGQLSFEKWVWIGKQLSDLTSSSAWRLGDWLAYGESAYKGRYRDAVEQTSLDYQTLRNYAWVAKRFTLSRRRDALSFGHHAEVAVLSEPEQDFWLRKAEQERWSRNRLRREVRASLRERERVAGAEQPSSSPGAREPERQSSTTIQLRLSPEQRETCQAAAEACGVGLEIWAVQVLESAASFKGAFGTATPPAESAVQP
jgi:hypothetical protein